MNFKCTSPCSSCPYRKDAKLQLWDKEEFEDLLKNEATYLGSIYGCHKDNGGVCVGWLMMQDKNRLPSIRLRISLSQNNVTREYLDSLHCHAPMFDTTKQMIAANYPHLISMNELSNKDTTPTIKKQEKSLKK